MNMQFPPVRSPSSRSRETSSQMDRIEARQVRIEEKLDLVLEALADGDADELPGMTLDGEPTGAARSEGEPL